MNNIKKFRNFLFESVQDAINSLTKEYGEIFKPTDISIFDGYKFKIGNTKSTSRGLAWDGILYKNDTAVTAVKNHGDGSAVVFYPKNKSLYAEFENDSERAFPKDPEPTTTFIMVLDYADNDGAIANDNI